MSRLRALLLGVAEYESENIQRLPCVPSDLRNIDSALTARGYEVAIPYGGGQVTRNQVISRVGKFLTSAQPGDTLLVYLSGHGVHADGEDYLVPTDGDLNMATRRMAVQLSSWNLEIDRSSAAGIVFLLDACREGIDESMSVAARSRWSPSQVRNAGRRQVAWIYPCAPGEVSRYVRANGKDVLTPFSLFAGAVVTVLNHPVAPVTLKEFEDSLRHAMNQLTQRHDKSSQDIRVETNGRGDSQEFVLFPVEERGPRRWEQTAALHSAWKRVPGDQQNMEFNAPVLALVRDLANRRNIAGSACPSDPWTEGGGFALRMTERMNLVLSSFLPDLSLTQAEATLLVSAPFLLDTHHAEEIAKAASAVTPDSGPEWWEAHRALAGQPGFLAEENLTPLLRGTVPQGTFTDDVLEPSRVSALLRAVYAENSAFAPRGQLGLAPHITVAAGRPGEQDLRERLVGILVTVANRLAIDVLSLSDLGSGEHDTLGPVQPSDLYGTLEKAKWEPYGRGRTLTAVCGHPAVEWALRNHARHFDELLAHLDALSGDSDLGTLRELPVRALAFGVRRGTPDDALSSGRVPALVAESACVSDSASSSGSLATTLVLSSAEPPGPASADDIIRWLLDVSRITETGSGRNFAGPVADLSEAARHAEASPEPAADELRPRLVALIREHQLLRTELQEALGPGAAAYNRALLSLAFGLPLSYEAYCQAEDALTPQSPLPGQVVDAILQDGPADVRIVMIALSSWDSWDSWDESKRAQWLAAHPVDVAAVIGQLAVGWSRPDHERLVLDGFRRLLGTPSADAPASVPVLRAALSPRGYLAERLAVLYPDDIGFQVDMLSVLLETAWSDEGFGVAAVEDTLRKGRGPLPTALIRAVRMLTGPGDSDATARANQLRFLAGRARPKPT